MRKIMLFTIIFTLTSLFGLNWLEDYNLALRKALSENKLICIYFYTPVAETCKDIESNFLSRSDIQNLLSNFICVTLNATKNIEIAKRCGIFRVPSIAIINSEGRVLELYVGPKKVKLISQKLPKLIEAFKEKNLAEYQKEKILARKKEREKNKAGKYAIHFKFYNPNAKDVSVVGDFNNWDITADKMEKNGDFWEVTLYLPKGRYEYKFYADGIYYPDPTSKLFASDPYGGKNSVLLVGIKSIKSPIITGNIVTFNYYDPKAKSVHLAGNFTNWQKAPLLMRKKENGLWTITLKFPPGKYQYKFIVDGNKWVSDPMNPQAVKTDLGVNSYFEIK